MNFVIGDIVIFGANDFGVIVGFENVLEKTKVLVFKRVLFKQSTFDFDVSEFKLSEKETASLVNKAQYSLSESDGAAIEAAFIAAMDTALVPINTVVPSIAGTVAVGSTLTANDGSWSGDPAPTYTRKWQSSADGGTTWVDISGQTASTLVLGAAQADALIRLVVTGTNDVGSSEAVSASVGPVEAAAPENTTAPAVSGSALLGATLTTTNGTWTGVPTPTIARQWQTSDDGEAGWTDVSGQTATTLSVTSAMLDKYIRCLVTATNVMGSESAASSVVGPIEAVAPANTVAPAVTGTAQVGETLTATNGTWTGNPTPTYTRAWQSSADGTSAWTAISGATATTLVLAAEQEGLYIRCLVTATNAGGSVSAASNVSGPVDPAA